MTSGRATASARRRKAKNDVILDAARAVFFESGYSGATTDVIQARAGVSKSTLYAHFSSKEKLFEAVCLKIFEQFQQRMEEATQVQSEDPREFLTKFGVGFLNNLFNREGKDFFCLMIDTSKNFPHLGKYFYAAGVKHATDMVERYLAEAHACGRMSVEWPALSSEHFMGMLRGDLHLRVILSIGRPPTQKQIRKYVDLTVDSFLKAHAA